MDLYSYHTDKEELLNYDKADNKLPFVFFDKYKQDRTLLADREDAIAKDAKYAFVYADNYLEGPFPKGEDAIATSAKWSTFYAIHVLHGAFPKGEDAIAGSGYEETYNDMFRG